MRMDTTSQVRITYSELESVLTRLGFVRLNTSEYLAFKEKRTDTLLLFPASAPEAIVPLHHLQMARVNSVLRGVTEEGNFDRHLLTVAEKASAALAA